MNQRKTRITSSSHETIDNCPGCSSANLQQIVSVRVRRSLFARIAMCCRCGLVFRSYRFTLDEIERRYMVDNDELFTTLSTAEAVEHEQRRRRRYERNLEWIEKHRPRKLGSRVLDIACGPGTGLLPFMEAGYDVRGVDISPARSRHAAQQLGIDVVVGAFERHPFRESEFDIIVCSHFLEHAHDPLTVLRRIRDMLTQNGLAYLEVPNHFNYASFSDAIYMAHNNNFTPLSLSNMLHRAGFLVVAQHEPTTKFYENAIRHIGMVVVPSDAISASPSPPNEDHVKRVVLAYLRGCAPVKSTTVTNMKYVFQDPQSLEASLHKTIIPTHVWCRSNGRVVAHMYAPTTRTRLHWIGTALKGVLKRLPVIPQLYRRLQRGNETRATP